MTSESLMLKVMDRSNDHVPLAASASHTVLVKLPCTGNPRPYPDTYQDRWESNYMKLPCSKFCFYKSGYVSITIVYN